MRGDNLNLILYLANKSGLFGNLNTSTSVIANDLEVSQQTVSRLLREIEEDNLIKRDARSTGITISLTDKARTLLKNQHLLLNNLFTSKVMTIKAKVTSGLKEGKYYMSLSGYRKQFKQKLGFEPFEGTLNLNIDAQKLNAFLLNTNETYINGFTTKERSFGGLKSFNIKIKNKNKSLNAELIMPDRTHHNNNTIEIIHKENLRNKLKLNDGDTLELTKGEA
jgi:riboflavin kinase, archaea type